MDGLSSIMLLHKAELLWSLYSSQRGQIFMFKISRYCLSPSVSPSLSLSLSVCPHHLTLLENGWTPVRYACVRDHAAVVSVFLGAGVRVDAQDEVSGSRHCALFTAEDVSSVWIDSPSLCLSGRSCQSGVCDAHSRSKD
jgi:hypothetical protein